jgi:hypothetical protein
MRAVRRGWTSGLSHDELGLDRDLRHVLAAICNPIKKSARCDFSHFFEWLAHGSERRTGVRRGLNVVEPNHRNIFRHP